jgi:hypothetical protein
MQDKLKTGDIVKFKSAETGETITGIVKYGATKVKGVTVAIPEDTERFGNAYVYKSGDSLEKVGHTDEYDPQDPFGVTVSEALENAAENETVAVRCDECGNLFQMEKQVVVKYGRSDYCNEGCGIKANATNREIGQRV